MSTQPTDAGRAVIDEVVVAELVVVDAEAGVDVLELLGLRIVVGDLLAALRERIVLAERVGLVARAQGRLGCCCRAVRSVNQTRPLPSMPTLRGSPFRFHMFSPKCGDGLGEALKLDTNAGALVGVLMILALFSAGSSSISASFICETP